MLARGVRMRHSAKQSAETVSMSGRFVDGKDYQSSPPTLSQIQYSSNTRTFRQVVRASIAPTQLEWNHERFVTDVNDRDSINADFGCSSIDRMSFSRSSRLINRRISDNEAVRTTGRDLFWCVCNKHGSGEFPGDPKPSASI